jgi:phenylpropionate dioxygenase-like ring-hydroxylating dioxygenase large terminal subunit
MFPAREGEGFSIKLEALPLPNEKGEVWVRAFVPKDRDDSGSVRQQTIARSPQAPARSSAPIDDDIPF